MPFGRTLVSGSPFVGVYLRVGEKAALVPASAPTSVTRLVKRILDVDILRVSVAESEILGSLVAFNSNGVVVGDSADDVEIAALSKLGTVTSVRSRQNALGNNILTNDHGALVHPEFGDHALREIGRALRVPVERGTVAGLGTVGMAAIATARGVVVHPRTTAKEEEKILELLKVPVHRSTANFGVPVVGACLVANSRGILAGLPTTTVEVVHLQEGLSVYD
ncbi:MAG: translation initiation factor IF-6 [Thermoplasmata archaeon]|nr:translation initiation factor IF-6 [Thermoplasmata archaeon]